MQPRDFLEEFVLPAMHEWQAAPLNVRRATIYACELDNLTEHCLLSEGVKRMGRARDEIGEQMPALATVRDIHDTHKHGPLDRDTATMKQGQRPEEDGTESAFQAGAFQSSAFQVAQLYVQDDNGTQHWLEDVFGAVLTYWRKRMGV